MSKIVAFLIGTLVLSLLPTMATGQDGKWIVKDDPGRCSLQRRMLSPSVTLSLDTIPGSDIFRVAIAADRIGSAKLSKPGELRFGFSQQSLSGLASVAKLPDGSQQVIWMEGIKPLVLDLLAEADTLTITVGTGVSATIPLSNTQKAVDAFRRCMTGQLIEWGADAEQFAPGGATPVSFTSRDGWLNPKQLLTISAAFRGSDLRAVFRVGVAPDGSVSDCFPVEGVPDQLVEKATCDAVLTKRLFTPAHDTAGKAVRGVATFQVLLMRR